MDFALKGLGDLHYFLRIEVKSTSEGLLLTQDKYASDLLHRADMMLCKEMPTPLATNEKLSAYGGEITQC
jgi:hypothetical protein